jgi:hypothetical protein
MNIHAYNGGGNTGHLGLVMTPVKYLMRIPGVAGYILPLNPGATAEIPDAATPVEAQNLIHAHAENMRAYILVNNVDKACCKAILDAFDNKFLSARDDPIVRYANETAISLITHLQECYAFISLIELVENYEIMRQSYDPSRPIEDLFKKMQDGRAYAQAGQQSYGTQQIINIAYALIFNTGVYGDACKDWDKYNILDKNCENFKAHFTTEHRLYRKQTQTAQAAGYQAANHAQQGMQNSLLIEKSEALAMMATASATYRDTMSNLFTSNAHLSTHLAERSAALATASEIIRSLRSVSRANGGSASTSATRAPSNATTRVHPTTNNENYC